MNNELIVLYDDVYLLNGETANTIAALDQTIKELKRKQDDIKEQLKNEMVAKNIKSIKDDVLGITISYIESTQRETFNSKKFREDHSDLYDEYVSFSDVKDSIRVTVK